MAWLALVCQGLGCLFRSGAGAMDALNTQLVKNQRWGSRGFCHLTQRNETASYTDNVQSQGQQPRHYHQQSKTTAIFVVVTMPAAIVLIVFIMVVVFFARSLVPGLNSHQQTRIHRQSTINSRSFIIASISSSIVSSQDRMLVTTWPTGRKQRL